jgi:hypothetical protein
VSAKWVYNGFYRWNLWCTGSACESATSLYSYLGLNLLVIPSVNSSEKKSTSPHRCNFPNKLYRPSAIRSVYTDKLISSIYTDHIADGRIPSVYTDRVGDEIIYIGKNYRRKNSIGFRRFSGSGICVLHRRNNFIGKIVKCCSESLLTARV